MEENLRLQDNPTFALTKFCKLISISLQSSSRLTTSKNPYREAHITGVSLNYIYHQQIENKIQKKNAENLRFDGQ